MNANLIGNFSKTIEHAKVMDLLGITMLVYDYSKKFTFEKDETIETFVSSKKHGENEDIKMDISDPRKEVLEKLSESSPHGRVVKFISDKTTDIQVGITISETNKRICVVFRGSESKSDWYYDFMILKRKILHDTYADVHVHSGFYRQLHDTGVYEKIVVTLKTLLHEHPDYDIYITGHSLGGALCTLFGFELSHEIDNHVSIVSFASPRVGNQAFKDAFDGKQNLEHYRITNDRDVITGTPMVLFKHVGKNIAICDEKCELFENYEYGWYKYSLFNCYSVGDHDVDLYYKRLCKHTW